MKKLKERWNQFSTVNKVLAVIGIMIFWPMIILGAVMYFLAAMFVCVFELVDAILS